MSLLYKILTTIFPRNSNLDVNQQCNFTEDGFDGAYDFLVGLKRETNFFVIFYRIIIQVHVTVL